MSDEFPYPKLYSNCCHAELIDRDNAEHYAGNEKYTITGRCPECQDGCEFLTEEEMENEDGIGY